MSSYRKRSYVKRSKERQGLKLTPAHIKGFSDDRLVLGEGLPVSPENFSDEDNEQQVAPSHYTNPGAAMLYAIHRVVAAGQTDGGEA